METADASRYQQEPKAGGTYAYTPISTRTASCDGSWPMTLDEYEFLLDVGGNGFCPAQKKNWVNRKGITCFNESDLCLEIKVRPTSVLEQLALITEDTISPDLES